jgi:hypothetical protein
MIRNIAGRLAKTKHIRRILENPTDLRELRRRPTFRMMTGLVLIGFSYLIGWPAVAALGILAAWLREPMVVVIGGPITYGLSHVVFLAGAWLAGTHYVKLLTRYATETLFRKLLRQDLPS